MADPKKRMFFTYKAYYLSVYLTMKKLSTLLLLTLILSVHAQEQKTLLYNVNIVHVEDGTIQKKGAVLIEGRTIKAVGDYKALKSNVQEENQINGAGKYLIPGLWDMHIHLEGADLVEDNKALLPVFLAYGITTVRDCASDLGEQVLAWRSEIEVGSLIGPTIFTAGRKLEGKNSIWKGDLEIENETELNQMLDLLDSYEVDFVKITENTLGGELFLKSVEAAHARGYKVSGHVPMDVAIDELVKAGFTSVEHASYLLRLGNDEKGIVTDLRAGKITKAEAGTRYAASFNQQLALEKYKVLGKAGLFVCPTFIGGRQLAYLDVTNHSKDEFLNYLTNRFVANYQWRIDRMGKETPAQSKERKERYEFQQKQLPLMHSAGIKIIAGSDAAALNTYVYPAESLLQELEIFQKAGLTPLQILQTATLNGAEYFNVTDQTGSIAVGKQADLVLLDKNPLIDISSLRSVNAVMAKGKYFNRATLDTMLSTARKAKQVLDDQRK
jgi:imidazolonepropionase-like amidohydrolase